MIPPSEWVKVHLDQIPRSGPVLDLACGSGRHARLLAAHGYPVLAVDRDTKALLGLAQRSGVTTRCLDLETAEWPLAGELFAGIVVTNYLWRPHLDALVANLQAGGVLLYETFMVGNARLGKPTNPDFLLNPGELRALAERHHLQLLGYEEGEVSQPRPAVTQRLAARRDVA